MDNREYPPDEMAAWWEYMADTDNEGYEEYRRDSGLYEGLDRTMSEDLSV